MRLLEMKNGFNFRDIGGYQTKDNRTLKYHKLIRSASLAELSPEELVYLDEYGMRHDVDFRSPAECQAAPDLLPENVHYHFMPVFPIDETRSTQKSWEERERYNTDPALGVAEMKSAYADIVLADSARVAYRKFFDVLLANDKENESVLFHCSMGKDRTGMGAVYVLTALGVDEQTIRKDYLASNEYLRPLREINLNKAKQAAKTPYFVANIRSLGRVSNAYLDHALLLIKKEYGSVNDYLRNELMLNDKQLQDLQKIYLN